MRIKRRLIRHSRAGGGRGPRGRGRRRRRIDANSTATCVHAERRPRRRRARPGRSRSTRTRTTPARARRRLRGAAVLRQEHSRSTRTRFRSARRRASGQQDDEAGDDRLRHEAASAPARRQATCRAGRHRAAASWRSTRLTETRPSPATSRGSCCSPGCRFRARSTARTRPPTKTATARSSCRRRLPPTPRRPLRVEHSPPPHRAASGSTSTNIPQAAAAERLQRHDRQGSRGPT